MIKKSGGGGITNISLKQKKTNLFTQKLLIFMVFSKELPSLSDTVTLQRDNVYMFKVTLALST